MAEEKKEDVKQDTAPEEADAEASQTEAEEQPPEVAEKPTETAEKPAEAAPETPPQAEEQPAAAAPETPAETTPPRKKKINQMSLAEIEAKLKQVQEQQGGLGSKYAQHLLQRKKALTS